MEVLVQGESRNPLHVVLDDERIGRAAQEVHLPVWRRAMDAYNARGVSLGPNKVSITRNHVLPVVETIVPRDATALHPQRPFIPIRAVREEEEWRARIKEDAVDKQMDRARYFRAFVSALRTCELYGTSFVEPAMDYWIENITQMQPITHPMTGQIVDYKESRSAQMNNGLKFKSHKPWAVLVPPAGDYLDEKRFTIIRELVDVSAVEMMIQAGRWSVPPGTTSKSLRNGPSGGQMQDWDMQFRRDKSIFSSDTGRDVGVLLRYYSEGRWIFVWNYAIVLLDTENQNVNLPRRTKPLAQLKMNPRIGSDEFYGKGWYEQIEDLSNIDDLFMSLMAHKILVGAVRWTAVDPNRIDAEQVRRAKYGQVLEVDGDVREAIQFLEGGEPSQEEYNFHGDLMRAMDERTGKTEILSGNVPSPKQTKGATLKLAENAETRLSFGARYFEGTYLPDLAELVTSISGQGTTLVQLADLVGFDDAMAVMSPDPRDIPGGFSFVFDGSDRVSRRAQKFEMLQVTTNFIGQNPLVAANMEAQRIFVRKWAEFSEIFKPSEVDIIAGQPGQPIPIAPPQFLQSIQGGNPGQAMQQTMGAAGQTMMPPEQVGTPALNQEAGMMEQ